MDMGAEESIKFEAMIEEASQSGKWVILNNLHLTYGVQEELIRSLRFLVKPNRRFRLWITS